MLTLTLLQLQYLQWASFAHNEITTTEGIAHPLLETLNLSCESPGLWQDIVVNVRHLLSAPSSCSILYIVNRINEVHGLVKGNLPMLQLLDLHANQLTSIAGIDIPTLRQLYVASNKLTGFQDLENLPQLTTLHARENQIAQLGGFTPALKSLQYLNLRLGIC